MSWALESNWQPRRLMEVGRTVDTSTGPARVMTDAGPAYLKAIGNRQGPHVLATDWVGTLLAKWFGLSTFDIAIVTLQDDDVYDLPHGATAEAGPAFAARAEEGDAWGGDPDELDKIITPADITRLVVFDTWALNCDRHYFDPTVRKPNYANVFLSTENVGKDRTRLIAMDHGLCFIRSGEDLTAKLANIDKVREECVYGLFPEFRKRLDESTIESCAARLLEMDAETAAAMVATVPREWDVSDDARRAWAELICRRADFVADNIHAWIDRVAPWFNAGE